jgi:uncharacterized protein YjbI with pentapeptide repeats
MATDAKKCEVESCPRDTWRDDTRCLFHSTDTEGKKDEIEEILKGLLSKHLLWLKSKGERGERLDLSDMYLRELDLRGSNLRQAILRGADLTEANLSYAAIWRSNICAANLLNADLTGANLEFALYLEAAKLLEVRSLKGVQNLNVTRLPDYPSLTEEEKAKLHRLCGSNPEDAPTD